MLAIIDPRLDEECVKNLCDEGFKTISVGLSNLVDEPVSGHPDIQVFIHGKNLFVHPNIDKQFLKDIENHVNVIMCSTKLEKNYPNNIPYNIAVVKNFAIHKKGFTDKTIHDYFSKHGINILDVKQGYSKCSTLIVGDGIITSDKSIVDSANSVGIDALLISDGFIDLPGYNYGFIGGASGYYDDTIYLTGCIDHHPDKEGIECFIKSKNMKLKFLSSKRIVDVGSIFFV